MQSPEPTTGERLRAIHTEQRAIRESLAGLRETETEPDGRDIMAPLGVNTKPHVPDKEGVRIFYVPSRSGEGQYVTVAQSEPGGRFEGSRIDESRLVVVLCGLLLVDGTPLTAGCSAWIAPNQPTNWASEDSALCAVLYGHPNPGECPNETDNPEKHGCS